MMAPKKSKERAEMRKVLFYGGCHANVLRAIFDRYCLYKDVKFDLIMNYLLIAAGKEFPYEELYKYDMVIYSPISNHGTYNTSNLLKACGDFGVKTLCYPWLQWNGYSDETL